MNTAAIFSISLLASACSHYWQKRTALSFVRRPWQSPWRVLFSWPPVLAVLFLLLSAVAWLGVLRNWSVSVAYPMLSLNLVIMLLVSRYGFGEPVTRRHWGGCAVIGLGVVLLAASMT